MASSPAAPAATREPAPRDHREAGAEALGVMREVLSEKPHVDGHKLTRVVIDLCRVRDRLIDQRRAGALDGGGASRLARLNSVISVAMAIQFPLGTIEWDALGRAIGWLEDILAE